MRAEDASTYLIDSQHGRTSPSFQWFTCKLYSTNGYFPLSRALSISLMTTPLPMTTTCTSSKPAVKSLIICSFMHLPDLLNTDNLDHYTVFLPQMESPLLSDSIFHSIWAKSVKCNEQVSTMFIPIGTILLPSILHY